MCRGDSNKPLSVEVLENKGVSYVATGENSTAVAVRKGAPRDDLVLKFLAAEQVRCAVSILVLMLLFRCMWQ